MQISDGNFCCKRCRYDRFSADLNESRVSAITDPFPDVHLLYQKRSDDESSVEEPSTSSSIQLVSSFVLTIRPEAKNSAD